MALKEEDCQWLDSTRQRIKINYHECTDKKQVRNLDQMKGQDLILREEGQIT